MSIRHIVLIPFKSSLSRHDIEKIMFSLAELKKEISQILSFSGGENHSIENLHQGYLHGFVMEFKDETDRLIYLEHPAHVKWVNEILKPALDEKKPPVVFDYTV